MMHRSLFLLWGPLLFACSSTIENARKATILVNGNCEMCEETIEEAVVGNDHARIEWDKQTRMAVITYDSLRTSLPNVLRRVALAGYDNELWLAPDSSYERLPHCCRYDRTGKDILPPRGDEPMNH